MVAGGKKAKAKDKNGKAGIKQRIKKGKSPEATDDQTTGTESPAPESPDLSAQEPEEQGQQQEESRAEQNATLVDADEPSIPAVDNDEAGVAGLADPDSTSNQHPTVTEDQLDDEAPQAPTSNVEGTSEPVDGAEEQHPSSEEAISAEPREKTPVPSPPAAPFSPVPALVPLPSPSLTEARFMSSPPPENHFHHPASPAFIPCASPVPKVSSPLARSRIPYMSPAMSPKGTPPPPAPAPLAAPVASAAPPSSAASFATAVHSPVMSSAGMVPPYSPYAGHLPPGPQFMHRSYSIPDQSYAASFQAVRDLSLNNGPAHENRTGSHPENENEPIELLQRIQSAIPDINRLLNGFRHTHSKLSSREAEIKQIGNQHEQALMHKDFYIEALQAQMRKTANESAEECTRLKNTINELRLELGNLQEKQKDLEDGLAVHQKSNEELSQTKVELEAQIAKQNTSLQEAQEAHEKEQERQKEEQEKALTAQKQELTELFEEIKNEDEKAAAETLEAREKELLSQQESSKVEYEKEKAQIQELLESERNELEATKAELASTIATLVSKETELETKVAELASIREDLAAKLTELDETRKELEDTREKNATELETLQQSHAGELESLRNSYEEQLAAAAKALDDKVAALEAHLSGKEQLWAEERTALEEQLSQKDGELSSAEREKEKLEGDGLVKERQLQRVVDEMRSTIDHLDQDCDRLKKTLHSFGEATDLKTTKGDQFFLDSFTQLSHLIYDLSKEHFAYLPIDPPKDILSKIPSELPPFLDNTPASRELRCAYVQHVISKTLTYRIFQPFLFTLGRRYDKADTFFQMLSMDIRRKSVRREAFWRQQTLKAAYTTSDAKQSINVAAAVIVDEIIDHIRHFADPKHLDSLLTGVRKVVKLAAETWRHARVERELVLATLPAPDADSVSNTGWQEYGIPKEASHAPPSDPTRHVVLRTFPRILREAAHEDFASGEERASPCIYAAGIVLYSDSPVVMARLQELAKKSTETLVADEALPLSLKMPRGSRESVVAQEIEKLNGSAPVELTCPSAHG